MKEEFLHYLWQHQYFDRIDLRVVGGERLAVVRPGHPNGNAGPDFLEAHLLLDEVKWAGSVEIHLRASDWYRHKHQTDPKYDQVILHVVWENDTPVTRTDSTPIPTLELRQRVAPALLISYQDLLSSPTSIPCAPFTRQVPPLTRQMMLDRALLERLEEKGEQVIQQLQRNGQDWEVTAYQVLAAGFGFKINQEPFARLSRALPLAVLKRHRSNQLQLEALLLGQAGLLPAEETEDDYLQLLRREYNFLAHKYTLSPEAMRPSDWNFLRLRPSNFPTVRLVQFAALLGSHDHLFSFLLAERTLEEYEQIFRGMPSAYWCTHYLPGKASRIRAAMIGTGSIHTLISNTVVPLLIAYGRHTGELAYQERALALIERLPAEHNRVTRIYQDLGWENKTGADSQGFLSLNRQYCKPRQCLACAIGATILKHNLSAS